MSKALRSKLASVLSVAMLAGSLTTPILANDYQNHWANEAITKWQEKGILKGYEDGSFKPKQAVTRAELAAMLVRVFGLTQTTNQKCEDVANDAWYTGDIAKVIAADIMNYEENTFRPEEPATRQEAAYAIAKAYHITGETKNNFKDNAKIADWAEDEIASLVAGGYLSGRPDGTFAPADTLTRADAVTMLDKITAQLFNQKGTYSENIEGNVIINAKDVSLKDMTIKGNLYIAEGVGNGDVTLENVKVTGKVFVEGGGMDTVEFKGTTTIPSLIVDKAKDAVRILTTGEASVKQVDIQSATKIQGNFGFVQITSKVPVTLGEGSKVATLLVAPEAKDTILTLEKDASIVKATLEAPLTLTGEGKIETLEVTKDVEISDIKSDITIDKAPEGMPGTGTTPGGGGGSTGGDTSEPSKTYSITGKVYIGEEVTTSAAIKAVPYYKDAQGNISFDHTNEVNLKTDEQGTYSLGRIKKGKNYKLSVSDNTRPEALYLQDIYLEKITSNQEVDIHLTQKTSLDFKVTADGKPVTQPVEVKLRWINPDGTYGRFSDGWIFDGASAWRGWQIGDQVEVDVIDPRYEEAKVRTIITEQSRNWVEVELVEKQAPSIQGIITLPDGTATKARVDLYEMTGEHTSSRIDTVYANEAGYYNFPEVQAGTYRLQVTCYGNRQDYYTDTPPFNLTAGAYQKDLTLKEVRGFMLKVVDQADQPLQGVKCELESITEESNWGNSQETNQEGRVHIIGDTWEEGHTITYTLSKPGYQEQTGTITLGEEPRYRETFKLIKEEEGETEASVTGTITLPDGTQASNAQVELWIMTGENTSTRLIMDHADAQGNYTFSNLEEGRYRIRVIYAGENQDYFIHSDPFQVERGSNVEDIVIEAVISLTVIVQDEAGNPIGGVDCKFELKNENTFWGYGDPTGPLGDVGCVIPLGKPGDVVTYELSKEGYQTLTGSFNLGENPRHQEILTLILNE